MNKADLFTENFQSLSGLLPDARYFHEYMNLDSDISFSLEQDGVNFLIPAEKVGHVGVIYPRSFAADFYSNVEGTYSNAEYRKLLALIEDEFRSQGFSGIQLRLLPRYITDLHDGWLDGYEIEEIRTSVVHLGQYELSARRKRNIKKGSHLNFIFRELDPLKIATGWSEIMNFLRSRQLFALSVERINYLVTTFPDHFSLAMVTDDQSDIKALALVNHIGNCLRLPNYFSKPDNPGAIDYLIDSIINYAISDGLSCVDLGVSTDPNTNAEVEGIVQFKSEFGATREIIRRYSKSFN